jgi:hypothetical protein
MQNLTQFRRVLLPRAAGALILLVAGAVGFGATGPDSWAALVALLVEFGGLVLLYHVVHLWMERMGGRARLAAAASRGAGQGCAIALLRTILIIGLIAAAGFWLWSASVDLNELRLIVTAPRHATAQVIGKELVASGTPIGYVHYAYRVSLTVAPEARFAVRHADYARYRTGDKFDVTYAAAAPAVHRPGRVDWLYAARRACFWLLVLANGAGYLFLPLWLLEFRRRPPAGQSII